MVFKLLRFYKYIVFFYSPPSGTALQKGLLKTKLYPFSHICQVVLISWVISVVRVGILFHCWCYSYCIVNCKRYCISWDFPWRYMLHWYSCKYLLCPSILFVQPFSVSFRFKQKIFMTKKISQDICKFSVIFCLLVPQKMSWKSTQI